MKIKWPHRDSQVDQSFVFCKYLYHKFPFFANLIDLINQIDKYNKSNFYLAQISIESVERNLPVLFGGFNMIKHNYINKHNNNNNNYYYYYYQSLCVIKCENHSLVLRTFLTTSWKK